MVTSRGFTLIELLVVIAIISTLLSVAVPKYIGSIRQAEEATLKQNLALMRDAIDKHFGDNGRYPDTLEELITKRYLRAMPVDTLTGATDTWTVLPPTNAELGRVYDVKSGSTEIARDGSAVNTW
ncbi:MAG: type secretion system protein [Betaproteobacteria bacterium]|nr:type secretion system protein [Betaproteobacteria bacterium]